MKSTITSLFLITLLAAQSETPKQRSLMELKSLWENSAFTVKPDAESAPSELIDWSLAGVSSNPLGGYTVTIVKKKDRTERLRVHSSGQYGESETADFKILEVSQSGYNYKETKVKLSVGGEEGWVSYDEKLLAVKPSMPVSNTRTQLRPGQPQLRPGQPQLRPGQPQLRPGQTANNQLKPGNTQTLNNASTPHQNVNNAGIPQNNSRSLTQGNTSKSTQQSGTSPTQSTRRPRIRRIAPAPPQ